MDKLTGYYRSNGQVGIRNLVAVMAAADNVNPLAAKLAAQIESVVCLPASYGRGQLGRDFEITLSAMAGLAGHPNVAECLIVSFEPESAERIAERVRKIGRNVETVSILDVGGVTRALELGTGALHEMVKRAAAHQRQGIVPEQLLVGLECGGSDTSSGLFGNPCLGAFCDDFVDHGGTAIFSEPVECLGCESLLAGRAVNANAGAQIEATITRYRNIALDQGVDLTGVNPTPDNIAGGLTTIEEKSLGAISKAGTRPIQGVLGYGEPPKGPGLWFMEAPAGAVENITALSVAGAQLIMFVTGSCNPVGHPVTPTLKICANPRTLQRMSEHIDVDLSRGFERNFTLRHGAAEIADACANIANGDLTAAEQLGFLETNVSRFGLSV